MNFKAWFGVAGVNKNEPLKVRKVGQFFNYLVALALFILFLQFFVDVDPYGITRYLIDYFIWAVFFLELVVSLALVNHKLRYITENWLNVGIVIIATPFLPLEGVWVFIVRALRLLLVLRFFADFYGEGVKLLKRNRFGQILMASAVIILGAGAIFAYIEKRELLDGIWYSLVTITTVGYGDIVPATDGGRLFGVILILFGVVFFSLVTANISAYLIETEERKLEMEILKYVKNTEKRMENHQKLNEQQVSELMQHMTQEIQALKKEIQSLKQTDTTKHS